MCLVFLVCHMASLDATTGLFSQHRTASTNNVHIFSVLPTAVVPEQTSFPVSPRSHMHPAPCSELVARHVSFGSHRCYLRSCL